MFNFNHRIYLDYASLTPIDKRVSREMKKYSAVNYSNSSSWCKEGVSAKNAMNNGRKRIADFIRAHPDEIVFTGSGTEANNMAILGPIEFLRERGVEYKDTHILVSAIEHSSVLECVKELQKKGVQIDYILVDSAGIIRLDDFKNKIRSNTVVVSIMSVNNETGAVQPIREIAKIIRRFRNSLTTSVADTFPPRALNRSAPLRLAFGSIGLEAINDFKYPILHTDAAQAVCHQELFVEQLGVDLLTLDGSKAYGPRGIGALFIRRNIPIKPILFGGGQENGMRSGTENIPGIMGFAKALDIIQCERACETTRIKKMQNYFIEGMKLIRSDIIVNGVGAGVVSGNDNDAKISPHIANISIPGIDNEFFVFQLDARGIACSTKSSCLRDDSESYVLKAMNANSGTSIRFSFGRKTKMRHIKKIHDIIGRLMTAKTAK